MAGSQDLSGASPPLTIGPDALALFTVSLDCQEMSWSIPLVLRGDQSHWFKRPRAYSASLSINVIGNFPVSSQNTLVNWLTDSVQFSRVFTHYYFYFCLLGCFTYCPQNQTLDDLPPGHQKNNFKKKKKTWLTLIPWNTLYILSRQMLSLLHWPTHQYRGQEVPSLGSQGSSSPEAWIDDCLFACSLGREGAGGGGVLCSSDWPQPPSKTPVSAS